MPAGNNILQHRVAAIQGQGARDYQEDSYLVLDLRKSNHDGECVLLLLADGMGGHAGGAIASEIAISAFAAAFSLPLSVENLPFALEAALEAANAAISSRVFAEPQFEGMGCTFVAALIMDNRAFWISVGDSPLWLLRNGVLQRLNADHSMVPVLDAMVVAGELSADQAAKDPRRNALRSALDGSEIGLVDLNGEGLHLQPGDGILLASDGLETLTDGEIASSLRSTDPATIGEAVKNLMTRIDAAARPAQDNTTIIFLRALLSSSGLGSLSSNTQVQQGDNRMHLRDTELRSRNTSGYFRTGHQRLIAILGCGLLIVLTALGVLFIIDSTPQAGGTPVAREEGIEPDSPVTPASIPSPEDEGNAPGADKSERPPLDPEETETLQ